MSLDLFRLNGRVAWITGATKGLGLQMAHALAGAGADVVVSSRHADEAATAAAAADAARGAPTAGCAGDTTGAST